MPGRRRAGREVQADTDGFVTGVRFYKGPQNTGTHTGSLWTASGQLLATATFTNESASGWQQVNFASPVAITAGTTYIASYYTPSALLGDRSYSNSQYIRRCTSPPAAERSLWGERLPHPGLGGNYWVDVVFTPPADTGAPTVPHPPGRRRHQRGRADRGAVRRPLARTSTAQHHDDRSRPVRRVRRRALAYNATSHRHAHPDRRLLANSTTYTVTVSGATDAAGNALAPPSFLHHRRGGRAGDRLWPTTTNPSTVDSGDDSAVELGVKFSPTSGYITGIRFYKSAANTGTHTGSLWTASRHSWPPQPLSTRRASGWQT